MSDEDKKRWLSQFFESAKLSNDTLPVIVKASELLDQGYDAYCRKVQRKTLELSGNNTLEEEIVFRKFLKLDKNVTSNEFVVKQTNVKCEFDNQVEPFVKKECDEEAGYNLINLDQHHRVPFDHIQNLHFDDKRKSKNFPNIK